jgi:uncharacterized protein (DUF3084 family)
MRPISRYLEGGESKPASVRFKHAALNSVQFKRVRDVQARSKEVEACSKEVEARSKEVEARSKEVKARSKEVEARSKEVEARSKEVMIRVLATHSNHPLCPSHRARGHRACRPLRHS